MNIKKRTEELKSKDENLNIIKEHLSETEYTQESINNIMCDVFEIKTFHNSTAKKRYERAFIKAFEMGKGH